MLISIRRGRNSYRWYHAKRFGKNQLFGGMVSHHWPMNHIKSQQLPVLFAPRGCHRLCRTLTRLRCSASVRPLALDFWITSNQFVSWKKLGSLQSVDSQHLSHWQVPNKKARRGLCLWRWTAVQAADQPFAFLQLFVGKLLGKTGRFHQPISTAVGPNRKKQMITHDDFCWPFAWMVSGIIVVWRRIDLWHTSKDHLSPAPLHALREEGFVPLPRWASLSAKLLENVGNGSQIWYEYFLEKSKNEPWLWIKHGTPNQAIWIGYYAS